MAQAINSYQDVNGKILLTSTSSTDIDSKAVIDSKMHAKDKKVTKIDDQVKVNDKKVSAYEDYYNILLNLKYASDSLRSPVPINSDSQDDAFGYRTFSVTCVGCASTDSANNYVTVEPLNKAPIGTYNLIITSLANPQSQISGVFTSTTASAVTAVPTAGFFTAGTFDIVNGAGVSTPITFNTGTSLVNVNNIINSYTAQTGVQSMIIPVSSTVFKLKLTAIKSGSANGFSFNDPSNLFSSLTSQVSWSSTAASDASITFENQPMSRSSNTVTDVIYGSGSIKLNLIKPTPALTSIQISVNGDENKLLESVDKFINEYNQMVLFYAKQHLRRNKSINNSNGSKTQTGEFDPSAVLSKETSLESSSKGITNLIFQRVSGLPALSIASLSDLGFAYVSQNQVIEVPDPDNPDNPKVKHKVELKNFISTNDNGAKVKETLAANPEQFRKLFQFDFNADSSNILCWDRGNNMSWNSFIIDIDESRPAKSQVIARPDGTSETVSIQDMVRITSIDGLTPVFPVNYNSNSKQIVGIKGTPIEGLKMVFLGTAPEVITVTSVTQGIADKIYNYATELTRPMSKPTTYEKSDSRGQFYYDTNGNVVMEINKSPGLVVYATQEIEDKSKKLNEDKEELLEKNNVERERLIVQLSQQKRAIAKNERIKQDIEIRRQVEFGSK